MTDSAVPNPIGEEFLQAYDVFVDRLGGLFVQLSITEADNFGDDLKGDPFAHTNRGKVIPEYFLDCVEGHRFVTSTFRRDVTKKDLFDVAKQEGEDALLALKMAIDGCFGNADLCRNPLDRQVFAAVLKN